MPKRRYVKFDAIKKAAIVENLAAGMRRGDAATKAGSTRHVAAWHRRRDPEFWEACEQAELDACELPEDTLYKLAVSGNMKAILTWLCNRYPKRWHYWQQRLTPMEAFIRSMPEDLQDPLREYLEGQTPQCDQQPAPYRPVPDSPATDVYRAGLQAPPAA